MSQQIEMALWNEFNQEQNKAKEKLEQKVQIKNSSKPPADSWTAKIVEKIRISELAFEKGVEVCPVCEYGLIFDDFRGWFICTKAKYSKMQDCDFAGNIVDFTERLMEMGRW